MTEVVRVEREGRLAIVTVNRPEVLNAINTKVLTELRAAFDHLSMDMNVGCIIVTGAGEKAFVAGADIKEMVDLTPLEMRRFSQLGRELGTAMAKCGKPIIAAVNGYALGGGCELAMACDLRISSDKAKFGQPEINLGIIPGFGGTQRLVRLVGLGWASELVFTGDLIDAATAERIGLVNRVVPHANLMQEVKTLALKISSKSPATLKIAKDCLHAALGTSLDAGLGYEMEAFALAAATEDKKEGMRAFIEKRKPKFKGQ